MRFFFHLYLNMNNRDMIFFFLVLRFILIVFCRMCYVIEFGAIFHNILFQSDPFKHSK